MERPRLGAFAIVAALAAVLPAQNLLRWDAWSPATVYTLPLKLTPQTIVYPMHSKSLNTQDWIGIEQTVTVPMSDYYWLHISGNVPGTGDYDLKVQAGTEVVWDSTKSDWEIDGVFACGGVVHLRAGSHLLRFLTTSDNQTGPHMFLDQPRLVPYDDLAPVIRAAGTWSRTQGIFTVESEKANILAAAVGPPVSVRIPGISGVLELDPTSLIILGYSAVGGVRLNLSGLLDRMLVSRYVRVEFQAATWTRFGPRAGL